jgi:hypothetical protein
LAANEFRKNQHAAHRAKYFEVLLSLLLRHKTRQAAAYRDFLTLWEGADSDIPILIAIAAKSEYAKLK